MTFEEFFAKKKIDLVLLEKAEPSLFIEFKSHFSAMGEKSFDHTKKFWFNKLRKLYHLASPAKVIGQNETAMASQAEPLSSPTIEQKPAFTPRFKSANLNRTEPSPAPESEPKPVTKPTFKPRNIPAKPVEPVTGEAPETDPTVKLEPKPVSKPAFRLRNIAVKPTEASEENALNTTDVSASNPPVAKPPGFRPRNIKPVADEHALDAARSDSQPGRLGESETLTTNPATNQEAVKQGYKPRFRLKNVPQNPAPRQDQILQPVKQELAPEKQPELEGETGVESDTDREISLSTGEKTPEQQIQGNNQDLRGSDDASSGEKPKPGYKPIFSLKKIRKPDSEI